MIKMYAVIYWVGDNDEVYPYLTDDGHLKLFNRINKADDCADMLEDAKKEENVEVRVISIKAA